MGRASLIRCLMLKTSAGRLINLLRARCSKIRIISNRLAVCKWKRAIRWSKKQKSDLELLQLKSTCRTQNLKLSLILLYSLSPICLSRWHLSKIQQSWSKVTKARNQAISVYNSQKHRWTSFQLIASLLARSARQILFLILAPQLLWLQTLAIYH